MLNVRKTASRAAKAPKGEPKIDLAPAPVSVPEVAPAPVVDEVHPAPETSNKPETIPVTNEQNAIKVDRGVPLPDSYRESRAKYPWGSLNLGDSFFIPGGKVETFYSLTASASRKHKCKYIARKWEENGTAGVRVWRIK